MAVIIDRRLNPKGKSIVNSTRFKMKVKKSIKKSVINLVRKGKIENLGGDDNTGKGTVSIDTSELQEPSIIFDYLTGERPFILPGNKNHEVELTSYIEGDIIPKPEGGGKNKGNQGSPDGEGDDDFVFTLPKEELQEYIFDGLELPNLEEKQTSDVESVKWAKNGYKTAGSPSSLALRRTAINSLGRRIGLKRPKKDQIQTLMDQLDDPNLSDEETTRIMEEIHILENRKRSIPWIDPFDLRYHNYTPQPKPIYNALMICAMDVSGSMNENYKDMAKRFYILLYRFLKSKYPRVEVVFIRYHSEARLCSEEEFFYGTDTGGTVISSAFEVFKDEVLPKYSPEIWNIYIAQTSDGDNFGEDNIKTKNLVVNDVLPNVKYFAYIQVGKSDEWAMQWGVADDYSIWPTYQTIKNEFPKKFAMVKVKETRDILPVFLELFKKDKK